MCMCVNHELVRTITRRSFKLGSPNLDQWCKTRWFRSLLFLGWSTLSFKVKFNLKSNITPFLACPHHHSSTVQARITRFGPRMHLRTVKVPIDFGLDWLWSSPSFSILKPIFLPNVFAQFLYYIYWDLSLVNISETIADDRSNQFGLLTERTFCRKLSRSISVDNRYCNRFINTGRPIFSLNHSGASAATVFAIPTPFGIVHARCYTRAERTTQSVTGVGSSLRDALTVPSTDYVAKIGFNFSSILRACTNSIAIYLIITKDLIFFLCIGHQQSANASCFLR